MICSIFNSNFFDHGFGILMIGFFTMFFTIIIRKIIIYKRNGSMKDADNDKISKIAVIMYMILFFSVCGFELYKTTSKHTHKNYNTNLIEIEYDSVMHEYLESLGMKLSYKSKYYKEGYYKKNTIELSYNEGSSSRYTYTLTDSSEDNFDFHDKIINYFFDVPPKTSQEIYNYIKLCVDREFVPDMVIHCNSVKIYVTNDENKKIKYVISKNNSNIEQKDNYIEIKTYNMDLDSYGKNLSKLVFERGSTPEKHGEYTRY